MKIALAAVLFCLCAVVPAMADVTKSDMKKLLDAGMSDSVMLEYIKSKAPVRMTANDLVELKKLGASDKVLAALANGIKDKAAVGETQETVVIFGTEPSYPTYYYGGYWGPYWYFGFGPGCREGRCGHSWHHCGPAHPIHPVQPHCPPTGHPGGHSSGGHGHGGHR